MSETVFPRWRFCLIAVFLLSDALYLPASPRELWLSFVPAGILAALLFLLVRKILGTADLLNLPGWGGKICAIALSFLSIMLVLRTFARLITFFRQTSFPSMPIVILAVLILLVTLCMARIGTVRLSTWALPTLVAVLLPLLLSLLMTAPDWEVRVLLPLLPHRKMAFLSMIWSTLLNTYVPLLFLYLLLQHERPEQKHSFTVSILFTSMILTLTCARNLMLLGENTAARILYPTYASAGMVSFGDFFQRAETLIAGCLTVCELGRIAVLLLVSAAGLRTAFRGIFPRKTVYTENKTHLQEE